MIDFAVENKTQTQQTKHSLTGSFCSNLDLNTAGEKPSLSVFVKIFVWCTRFSFVGLNRTRNFHFLSTAWVRCITTLGRACWRQLFIAIGHYFENISTLTIQNYKICERFVGVNGEFSQYLRHHPLIRYQSTGHFHSTIPNLLLFLFGCVLAIPICLFAFNN